MYAIRLAPRGVSCGVRWLAAAVCRAGLPVRAPRTRHMLAAAAPPARIASAIAPNASHHHGAGNRPRTGSISRSGPARKTIVGFRVTPGPTPLDPPHDATVGAGDAADEVTNVTLNATAAPGVIATGHGLNAHVANPGKFDGHWNFTISPFCPNTLSGATIALNVAVPPCATFTSSLCPLASCKL